jgi:hypothetical protein
METLLTLICSIAVGAHPAFAANKHHRYSTARAQAAAVTVYPAPISPIAPYPLDPLYAGCSNVAVAFPACPGY